MRVKKKISIIMREYSKSVNVNLFKIILKRKMIDFTLRKKAVKSLSIKTENIEETKKLKQLYNLIEEL